MVGRSRKDGDRHPCGKLVQAPLSPPDLIEKRRIVVGDHAADPDASYPLGILRLRKMIGSGDLHAGLKYAAEHHLVFGRGTPRSHFAHLVSGGGEPPSQKRINEAADALGAANAVLFALGTRRPYQVLQNIAVYEREMRFMDINRARTPAAWAADQRDLDALQEATDALAKLWGLGHYAAKRAAD